MPENNSCQPAMPYFQFRQASLHDFPAVWEVVNKARDKMLASGRTQWSASYPSEEIIRKDIENETGYVLCSDDTIAAFARAWAFPPLSGKRDRDVPGGGHQKHQG